MFCRRLIIVCVFLTSFLLLYLMSQLLMYWILHLLKSTIQVMHLLCKYIVWYSLLIYPCHIGLFHCVIFSLCDFQWQDVDGCISVNVIYHCYSFQKFYSSFSQSLLQYCETASQGYPDNCPPKENCPPVRVGLWFKVRNSFRVGDNQTITPEENCPPGRVRVWLRISFGIGSSFPRVQLPQNPSRDKLSQHLYIHAQQHWDVPKDVCVCIGKYILARITLELQSSLNIYTKHMLHTFIFFFFILFIYLFILLIQSKS